MPQLNQPYSYFGEYAQLSLLVLALLALVCFYIMPGVLVAQVCAVVTSATKSPLEQFAVSFTPQGEVQSFVGGLMHSLDPNMVGVYGFVSFTTLVAWT